MNTIVMVQEAIRASVLIFLAELGDKTQILAMAFALQFSIRQVLAGVAIGSFFNHGLAVVVGAYLAYLIPFETIRFTSALLFLGFGLWSLMPEDDDEEEKSKTNGNPIFVVALAFFLGELGDKTQLTAIALASTAEFPAMILLGTVTGMVLTSLMGIIVGRKLGERIPEFTLKLVSGGVFIAFGTLYLSQTVPKNFLTPTYILLYVGVLTILILSIIIPPLRRRTLEPSTKGQLKKVAGTLHALEQVLDEICLGEDNCRGRNCPVGYCQNIIRAQLGKVHGIEPNPRVVEPYVKRNQCFDPGKVQRALDLLEKAELDPRVHGELKVNLEKLINPPQ